MNLQSEHTLPAKVANHLVDYLANENIILIGGQAVMFWAHFYGLVEEKASLTRDIDFFGQRADVEDANLRLANFSHKTKYADWDDTSPNSGVILVDVPELKDPVQIDFLWAVHGLSGSDVRERAVQASIPGIEKSVSVLHPFMCLESKIANLGSFPKKRSPEGIEQTRLAVQVVRAIITKMLDDGRERDALNLVERTRHIALSDASNFAFAVCKVDVLDAIPAEKFGSETFKSTRWPQIKATVGDRRQRFTALLPNQADPANTKTLRYRV